jgi:FKBP-type peptidyl-prolyl cis-trans isomerase (trigger factor)
MLETKSKQLEGNKVELTVVLSAEEVDKEVKAAYKQAGKQRIPGFRPGKAPRKVLDNHFGGPEYFLANATDELVRDTAPLAVDAENLIALGSPDFKEFDLVKEGEAFEYGFTLEVTPQLELSSYDPIQIELPSAEPTPQELQIQLDSLLDYYATEDEEGNRVPPELTDAWVKEVLEFESVDELNTRITDSIREQKEIDLPSLREFRSSTEIAKRLVGDIPESMVKQTEQDNYKDLFQSLQSQRVTLDTYLEANQLTPESFRDSMHEQARQSAAIALALDALGRNLGLTASDDEVKDEFLNSGAKDPESLFERWKENGRLSEIRQGLVRVKAAKHVYDTAEVFEPGTLKPSDETPAKKTTKKAGEKNEPAAEKKGASDAEEQSGSKAAKKPSKTKTAKKDSK